MEVLSYCTRVHVCSLRRRRHCRNTIHLIAIVIDIVVYAKNLWDEGDAVLVDAEAGQAEALARRLAMYRLRRPIAIEPVADAAVHWAIEGAPDDAAADPRLAALGRRWLGVPGAAAAGWREHRLSLGVAEGVDELGSGETLWLEACLLRWFP